MSLYVSEESIELKIKNNEPETVTQVLKFLFI